MSRTRYPRFIFGLPLPPEEIPVFTYHDVEEAGLSRDLDFLRSNGYRTLCLEEYLAARRRGRRGRSVLLTFDDARKSFWDVAMPVLRAFEAHAVLFAPSYWMSERSCDEDLFMSWEQLRACVRSGLVDVQSHAHRHALVPVSSRLVDFANPQALARFDIYDWPMRCVDGVDDLGRPPLGTPIYHASPLLGAPRHYLENGELTRACQIYVTQAGGAEYFSRPDWRRRLHSFYRERARGTIERFTPEPVFRQLVASEFELSREHFRKQLGYAPTCIAYPWMLGSELSLKLAERTGFRSAFGVALDYGAERRSDRLPIPIFGRLKCDWLRFLPGARRSSVFGAIGRKLADVASIQHLAH